MIRLTLTQMRLNAGRLTAAGLAVALGTAYVAATLLANGLLTDTIRRAVSAAYRGADVVVTEGEVPAARIDALRRLPQLAGADPYLTFHTELASGTRSGELQVASLPRTPELRTATVTSGSLPAGPGQVAVTAEVARRLQVAKGGVLNVRVQDFGNTTGGTKVRTTPVTVVGILTPANFLQLSPDVVADPDDAARWYRDQYDNATFDTVVAHAAPGVSPEQARDAVAALPGWGEARIRTGAQQADAMTKELTDGIDVLAAVLLAFAAIALFVAGMVILNTFQVLVAQRTRALALLRCVGATRRQLRSTVLLEAALLGLVSSAIGLLAGIALVNAVAGVLSTMDLGIEVPTPVPPTPAAVVTPLVLGMIVTVLAALSPARAATRVAPVAALRPAQAPTLRARAGKLRLALGVLLVGGGFGLLVFGAATSIEDKSTGGLPIALAGGMVSFLGILLLAVVFIPRLVGGLGNMIGRWGGVPARIAAANAVRNPRRTATTSAALLIGVTLVATMLSGAAVFTATAEAKLNDKYPVDVLVISTSGGQVDEHGRPTGGMAAPVQTAVTGVGGVAGHAGVRVGGVRMVGGTGSASEPAEVEINGVDPAEAARVVNVPADVAGLRQGVAIVPQQVARELKITSGTPLRFSAGSHRLTVRATVTGLRATGIVVTSDDLQTLIPHAPVSQLWLRVAQRADGKAVVSAVKDVVAERVGSGGSIFVAGAIAERLSYEHAVDTALSIMIGLLAVAVVIALIGVANTLSLSVIERTRESAVLRALGLTRRQLRAMLAVEGALIAGIAAAIGIVLGLIYGYAGFASVAGGAWEPTFAAPVTDLAILVAVGIAAGLAASVLPGRRAARTAPVAALGE